MEKFESVNAHTAMLSVCLFDPQKLSTSPFSATLMGSLASTFRARESRHKHISMNETMYKVPFHAAFTVP